MMSLHRSIMPNYVCHHAITIQHNQFISTIIHGQYFLHPSHTLQVCRLEVFGMYIWLTILGECGGYAKIDRCQNPFCTMHTDMVFESIHEIIRCCLARGRKRQNQHIFINIFYHLFGVHMKPPIWIIWKNVHFEDFRDKNYAISFFFFDILHDPINIVS